MTDIAHSIWAAGVASVAYVTHRVAVTWLNQRERKAIRDEHRDERDSGVTAKCEAMEADLKAAKLRIDTFIANNGTRR